MKRRDSQIQDETHTGWCTSLLLAVDEMAHKYGTSHKFRTAHKYRMPHVIIACDSSMLMRFSHAHAGFLCEREASRRAYRRFGEDGVDQEETEERDVWIRRELVNRKREEQGEEEAEAEVDKKAEIDSIDSPYAHVVLPCS
jgi:hypothetical protein